MKHLPFGTSVIKGQIQSSTLHSARYLFSLNEPYLDKKQRTTATIILVLQALQADDHGVGARSQDHTDDEFSWGTKLHSVRRGWASVQTRGRK